MNRVLVIAALTFAVALPLRAQDAENNFETFIAGKVAPLTMRLGDLNDSWRRMTPSSSDNGVLLQMVRTPYGRNGTYNPPDYLYTQGKTVSVAGEPFVIMYRLTQAEPQVPQSAGQTVYDGYPSSLRNQIIPPALSHETLLQLSLINPRMTGRFDNVQNVDVEKDIQQSQKARISIVNQLSLANLQQIGTLLSNYVRAVHKLPSLKDAATMQKELRGPDQYNTYGVLLVQTDTQKPYRTNATLSGQPLKSLSNPAKTVVLYESQASADGKRGVVFADGSVDRIDEKEFARLLKLSVTTPQKGTVKLYGEAALAYLAQNVLRKGEHVIYYRSMNGLIYYRDNKTHQAIYYTFTPNAPIVVDAVKAKPYSNVRSYNSQ